jgi:hypothetical protein
MSKFKIDYTWDRRELFEKVKAQLISEGWEVCDEFLPAYPEHTPDYHIFYCCFEKNWKLENFDITPKLPKE